MFRQNIADEEGCSVRTVARTFARGKEEGFIGVARGKKNEVPPGADGPRHCGWSHRWTIGLEGSGEARRAAVNKARLAYLVRLRLRQTFSQSNAQRGVPHMSPPARGLTPEQRKRLEELEADERAELEAARAEFEAMAAPAIAAAEARARDGPGDHN